MGTSAPNELFISGVGSYDWAGNVAPYGGTHSGQCRITMWNGQQFVVQCTKAEAEYRIGSLLAEPIPQWLAFDVPPPGPAIPVVLNAGNVRSITEIYP